MSDDLAALMAVLIIVLLLLTALPGVLRVQREQAAAMQRSRLVLQRFVAPSALTERVYREIANGAEVRGAASGVAVTIASCALASERRSGRSYLYRPNAVTVDLAGARESLDLKHRSPWRLGDVPLAERLCVKAGPELWRAVLADRAAVAAMSALFGGPHGALVGIESRPEGLRAAWDGDVDGAVLGRALVALLALRRAVLAAIEDRARAAAAAQPFRSAGQGA